MKKFLVYVISFIMMFVVGLVISLATVFLAVGIVAFVTWSLPVIIPAWLYLFRVLCVSAFFLAIAWIFSKENKEFVKEMLE